MHTPYRKASGPLQIRGRVHFFLIRVGTTMIMTRNIVLRIRYITVALWFYVIETTLNKVA